MIQLLLYYVRITGHFTALSFDVVKPATVEKGVEGGAPDSPADFATMENLYFESMDSFQNFFGPNAEKIMGDLPYFTNIEPVVQISE